MTEVPQPRRIVLCADDYGLSEGVNRGIRELIAAHRLNATSVMVVTPAFTREEIVALKAVVAGNGACQIGLHVTLTAPFRPLTLYFRPLDGGSFLTLSSLLRASLLRRLDPEIVPSEIGAPIETFTEAFDRAPDYLDGHQHVQLFPQIRDAFLAAAGERAPKAWLRQGGRAVTPLFSLGDAKARFLDMLSTRFRQRANAAGFAFNPAFAGAYDFSKPADYGALFAGFLDDLPEGGLVMCHPGFVDDTLRELDPLTAQREVEYDFFRSDSFARLLADRNVTLGLN